MVVRIGVLVSGRGSNLEAILRATGKGLIRGAKVAIVISSRPDAPALRIAEKHGVKTATVSPEDASGEGRDSQLARILSENGVEPGTGLVLLAGYMKILSKKFVELYSGRVMNIHPSLLPSFPGLEAQRQALEYGVKVAGCTVHFVVPEVDAGPIIIQRAVEVAEGDDEESLSSRILRQEHRIYPKAVKLFVEGRVKLQGRRVLVSR